MKTDFLQWIGNLLGIGIFMLLLACIARNECQYPSTYPVVNSSSSTAIEPNNK